MFNIKMKSFIIFICFLFINFGISESESYNSYDRGYQTQRRTSNTCRSHNDCPANSFCDILPTSSYSGFCLCTDGYMLIDVNRTKSCYKVATTLNDACDFNEQCMLTLSTDAECRYGICQCRQSTHYVKRENKCYTSVKLGDYCRLTNNCIGDETICRDGRCECPVDTHPNHDMTECLKNVKLGQYCLFDDECISENSRCHDICRCRVSHILNKDEDECLRVADHLGDICMESEQCTVTVANSVCHLNADNGNCTCRTGFHQIGYKCWVTVNLNEICESDENCALNENSICRNERCICDEGFREIYGECSSAAKILISLNFILILVFLQISKNIIINL